jgi:hypothetical protein
MTPTANPKAELEQLAKLLLESKGRVTKLRDYMAQLEARITELVGAKEEGTTTMRSDSYKVTTTGGLTRVIGLHDPAYWRERLGSDFDDLLTEKVTLKTTGFRRASSAVQDLLMEHMVIKPKKVAVKVEPVEAN